MGIGRSACGVRRSPLCSFEHDTTVAGPAQRGLRGMPQPRPRAVADHAAAHDRCNGGLSRLPVPRRPGPAPLSARIPTTNVEPVSQAQPSRFSTRKRPIMSENDRSVSHEELVQLQKKFSEIKHAINNALAVMMALSEMSQRRPDYSEKLASTVLTKAPQIVSGLQEFTQALNEKAGGPKTETVP